MGFLDPRPETGFVYVDRPPLAGRFETFSNRGLSRLRNLPPSTAPRGLPPLVNRPRPEALRSQKRTMVLFRPPRIPMGIAARRENQWVGGTPETLPHGVGGTA